MSGLPKSVSLELTYNCNHRCRYCYNHDRCDQEPYKEISLEHFREVLKAICKHNPMHFVLTGGEPLLRKDLVEETLKVARENNIEVTMNTNLTLLTPKFLDKLIDLGLSGILTSLYHYDRQKHNNLTMNSESYDRVVANIKTVSKRNLPLIVNMVVTKENINDIVKTGLFVKELGCNDFAATAIQTMDQRHKYLMLSREDIAKMLDSLLELGTQYGMHVDSLEPYVPCLFDDPKKYQVFLQRRCTGGGDDWVIKPNGDVKACLQIDNAAANILKDSFSQIVSSFSDWKKTKSEKGCIIPPECHDCAEVTRCRGGCRSIPFGLTGRLDAKNPYMRKPLKEKIDFKIRLTDFINEGFREDLKPIIFRREGETTLCHIKRKYIRLNQSEFALLRIIMKDETLFRESIKEFAAKYRLDLNKFNIFLNKISNNQIAFNISY